MFNFFGSCYGGLGFEGTPPQRGKDSSTRKEATLGAARTITSIIISPLAWFYPYSVQHLISRGP